MRRSFAAIRHLPPKLERRWVLGTKRVISRKMHMLLRLQKPDARYDAVCNLCSHSSILHPRRVFCDLMSTFPAWKVFGALVNCLVLQKMFAH